MSPNPSERWARIEAILDGALDLPASEREAYLARECAGQPELRREVEALLAADRSAGDFLETPAARMPGVLEDFTADSSAPPATGSPGAAKRPDAGGPRRVGRYTIRREIGRGGMGVVYEAEQENPRRAVALKVILGGAFVDEHRVRLFEREAQTLGRLEHPGIAAIYEAGRTEEGQHFFALELVRGVSLDEFLRGRGAAASRGELRGRLALFLKICGAIAYAHQRGVVHRDIKPSNILVTEETRAAGEAHHERGSAEAWASDVQIKVLDFGIARITDPDLTLSTLASEPGRARGTLPYMSPEQVRGDPSAIDVRSDVYSLGVVLYEMLAGARPYDVARAPTHEVSRVICEEPPKRPGSLNPILAGDVETILLKALEKDPARRYQTAAGFADDVARLLADEPILARPPSAAYQLSKLVARHRVAFAFVVTLIVLLAGFGVTMSLLFAQQRSLRARAETESAKASRTVAFLVDMLTSVEPEKAGGREVTVREVLDAGSQRVASELRDQPEVRASLEFAIGAAYQGLGLYDEAERHLSEVVEVRRSLFGPEHPEVAKGLYDIGKLYVFDGNLAAAESVFRSALSIRRKTLGSRDPLVAECEGGLAQVARQQGRFAEAESLFRDALSIAKSGSDADSILGPLLNGFGLYLQDFNRFAEAETLAREVIDRTRRQHGEDHPDFVAALHNLAIDLRGQRRFAEAESVWRAGISIGERILGEDDPELSLLLGGLSNSLGDQGRDAEAESLQLVALGRLRRSLGPDNPSVARRLNALSVFTARRKAFAESESLAREAVNIYRKNKVGDRPEVANALTNLGVAQRGQKKLAEAESSYREALAIRERIYGPDDAGRFPALHGLAMVLMERSRFPEAESLLWGFLSVVERTAGKEDPNYGKTLDDLEKLYSEWGKVERAHAIRAERDSLAGAKPGSG